MESWRQVWRQGVAPQLSTAGLEALRTALLTDDPQLVQGHTVLVDQPTAGAFQRPPAGACAIGYAGWQGEGLETTGEVIDYFSEFVLRVDRTRVSSLDPFLNFFDNFDRAIVFRMLLPEVNRELARSG